MMTPKSNETINFMPPLLPQVPSEEYFWLDSSTYFKIGAYCQKKKKTVNT